ncbi:MAG TPA: ectonucleotide pyrophosphatase/phosphodiesterase [Pyrinomonadaceae bacterium]|nr:ectonucleotide pyrophosphatase/phosphodiesterase [Pyrinomonadaceae bacterium]
MIYRNRVVLVIVSAIVALSACAAAQQRTPAQDQSILLISIDGFRDDYFELYKPPTINRLASEGTRAKWMLPAYPTKTFPNHYTIVTGLYPDNHGMIENNMWDPETNAVFGLNRREEVENPRWWGGEPIWNTAQKQGLIAGAFFWPGTETAIGGMQPKFWRPYQDDTPHNERVDTVLGWFDLPSAERPRMMTLYFSDVDGAGHRNGPDAPQTREAVMRVDRSINRLMDGIAERGLLNSVNVILTSDHGMAPYKMRDAIILDELFDQRDAHRVFWVSEFTQIFPRPGREKAILNALKKNLPKSASVYGRGRFPARFKFGDNDRVAPIVVVPNEGTILTTRQRYNAAEKDGNLDQIRGGHGYDNELVSMRAMFIGYGPAFKNGFVAEPFEAVDVYELMCRILGIKPAKNDGKFERISAVLASPPSAP